MQLDVALEAKSDSGAKLKFVLDVTRLGKGYKRGCGRWTSNEPGCSSSLASL